MNNAYLYFSLIHCGCDLNDAICLIGSIDLSDSSDLNDLIYLKQHFYYGNEIVSLWNEIDDNK